MVGINTRLGVKQKIVALDFQSKRVQLQGENFTYTEKLENVQILEDTGVILDGICVYVNDKVTDGSKTYTVKKVPGGYFPFMIPNKKDFRRV